LAPHAESIRLRKSRIRADFAARVDAMSADELKLVQADLEKKFQILNTPEAQEIRAWLGSYLSVLTERGREGVMRIIPNFDTMNSQQLQQTLGRLGHYRDSRAAQNAGQCARPKKNPWVTHAGARRSSPSGRLSSSPFRPSFAPSRLDSTRLQRHDRPYGGCPRF
jgi:hypothetical protein